jgi:serine/threonine protein kinase
VAVTREDIEAELGPCDEAVRVGSPSGVGECWRIAQGTATLVCKILLDARWSEHFAREAAALARLRSSRVLSVRGEGSLRSHADGQDRPYLLSDYIEGGDARVNASADLPDERQLRAFLAGTLDGLCDLHAAAVIHGDVKAENIVLRRGDWADPVLIDLGLSRVVPSESTYREHGGTWTHMAPEQLAGEPASERSDVWALAVVAHLLAIGSHPLTRAEETTRPADWEARLKGGVPAAMTYPGLDAWLRLAGHAAPDRRPDAVVARALLDEVWT